jgi:hypothetical protein
MSGSSKDFNRVALTPEGEGLRDRETPRCYHLAAKQHLHTRQRIHISSCQGRSLGPETGYVHKLNAI